MTTRIAVIAVGLCSVAIVHVYAQASSTPVQPRQTFEVASVKPNKSGEPRVMVRAEPGGRFTATNVTLRLLIRNAYGITEDSRIVDAPGWISVERFDVVAKAAPDVPPLIPGQGATGPMNLMLQALLEDRFQLRLHRESRELPVYVLVFPTTERRLGPRLTPTTVDCAALLAKLYPATGPAPPPSPFVPGQPPPCGSTGGPGQILAQGMTMAQLASNLSSRVNRVVVDKTGMPGDFDLNLEWMPDQFQGAGPLGAFPGAPPSRSSDAQGPSIYTALQEQLGLKLESTREAVDVLVVDRVEPPTLD